MPLAAVCRFPFQVCEAYWLKLGVRAAVTSAVRLLTPEVVPVAPMVLFFRTPEASMLVGLGSGGGFHGGG
jgi:hypothetical protein